jgi:hypothetical protein
MEDSTSLDALLPSPQGPQSAPPMMPMASVPAAPRSQMVPTYKPSLPAMRFMFAHSTLMISYFLSSVIISLSTPRNLLLQYVPNSYTSGGVVSWTGAAILGAAAVVLTQIINNFLSGFLG